MDSIFSNIGDAAIEMGAPSDQPDKGFTGLILDNVNMQGIIRERGTSNTLKGAGLLKHVS